MMEKFPCYLKASWLVFQVNDKECAVAKQKDFSRLDKLRNVS